MQLSPDEIVYWSYGPIRLNATIVHTWIVMVLLVVGSSVTTRKIRRGEVPTDAASGRRPRSLELLEALVATVQGHIEDVVPRHGRRLLPFLGTLFLFIATANVLSVVPFYRAPTASLSTTSALAVCVFLAVPAFGIARKGVPGYLRNYLRPTPIMLPFHVIGELSRTLALAVRLFGNMMSGSLIGALLLSLTPFLIPVAMQAIGLLTGVVQAYVFAVLTLLYVGSAMRDPDPKSEEPAPESAST